ncbi:MAG TPA: aldolase/citrate lyase family protein [Stellaceae bacterium]|nr:aldolase/citrate lyase family protein [Stellaceae bacterium]
MNAIKDSIKSGRTVVGTTVTPNVDVSTLADAGYDFLLFDTQHSAWEIKQLQPSIQTMRGKQAAPLVRVAANQAYQICFALDAGARGVVVPMVNTSAEAEAAVRACRYFPLGNRSNAGVRGEWGEFKNYRDYLDTVNNGLVIVPMIETNQSLENLDAIASVPGVDVLLIGPSDLSIELGVPLDYQCDIYQRALDKIAATAAKHGIAAGMYFIPPEMDPNFFVQKGFIVLHHAVGSLGEGRHPGRPGRDQALTTVDADGPANSQIAPLAPLIRRAVAVPGRPSVGSKAASLLHA